VPRFHVFTLGLLSATKGETREVQYSIFQEVHTLYANVLRHLKMERQPENTQQLFSWPRKKTLFPDITEGPL